MQKEDREELLRTLKELKSMMSGRPPAPIDNKPPPKTKRPSPPKVYTLTIECVWGPTLKQSWLRVLEVGSRLNLRELHGLIQRTIGFEGIRKFEFFIGRQYFDRKIVFADGGDRSIDAPCEAFELSMIWPVPAGGHLFYRFPAGADWTFHIKKERGVKAPETGVSYPRLHKELGPNPQQPRMGRG